ncbi:MAG TPA: type VI secretion system-associated FHA domain protein, partial [Polyangiaceae bacterium]|nr:type VI secretion system-associated FHA domain protein [Polyangiaceae bacterium]
RTGFEFSLGSEVWLSFAPSRPSIPRVSIEAPPPPPPPARPARTPAEFSAIGDGLPVLPQIGRPPRELPSLELPPGASLGDAGQFSLPGLPRQASSWEPEAAEPPPLRPAAPARGFEPVKAPPGLQPERGAGGLPELRTGSFDLNLETLALQGLREIVASLLPGRSLDSRGDVARLISRLHNTFEVLCRSFLSLRDGYTKFMANLHLQRSAQYDPGRVALASARDPAAVAGHLLDFRENAPDASQALEAELKELSLHQVALIDGLMEGIRALLEELSPDAIANEVEHKGGGGRLGRGERALWQEYCERYARFAEDGEAFARVFGAEFSSAYRNYRRRRGAR